MGKDKKFVIFHFDKSEDGERSKSTLDHSVFYAETVEEAKIAVDALRQTKIIVGNIIEGRLSKEQLRRYS